MRRMVATSVLAIVAACGSFGAEADPPPATPTPAEAGVDASSVVEDVFVPPGALDSGEGTADATSATSSYGAAVLADGPVAYWRMDLVGGIVSNVIAQQPALIGSASGGAFAPVPGALGKEPDSGAIQFAGKSLESATPDAYDFPRDEHFTIECWAKWNGVGSGVMAVVGRATVSGLIFVSTNGYLIALDTGVGKRLAGGFVSDGSELDEASKDDLELTNWHHYAMVVDANVSFYVDGALAAATERQSRSGPQTTPFTIGGKLAGRELPFPGDVDEVAIYDKALGADRIKAHFDASK